MSVFGIRISIRTTFLLFLFHPNCRHLRLKSGGQHRWCLSISRFQVLEMMFKSSVGDNHCDWQDWIRCHRQESCQDTLAGEDWKDIYIFTYIDRCIYVNIRYTHIYICNLYVHEYYLIYIYTYVIYTYIIYNICIWYIYIYICYTYILYCI